MGGLIDNWGGWLKAEWVDGWVGWWVGWLTAGLVGGFVGLLVGWFDENPMCLPTSPFLGYSLCLRGRDSGR